MKKLRTKGRTRVNLPPKELLQKHAEIVDIRGVSIDLSKIGETLGKVWVNGQKQLAEMSTSKWIERSKQNPRLCFRNLTNFHTVVENSLKLAYCAPYPYPDALA